MTEDDIRRALRDSTRVTVRGSDYKFDATLQAVFIKRNGALRVVVEDDNRVLHIASPRHIEPLHAGQKCEACGSTNIRLHEGYDMAQDKKLMQTLCLSCAKVRAEYVE